MRSVYLVRLEFARPDRKDIITEVAGIFQTKTEANLYMGDLAQFHATNPGSQLSISLSGSSVKNEDGSTVTLYVEGRDFGPMFD